MQNIENERMNNLPSVKASNNSKKHINEMNRSISDETLVNAMMLIDNNTSDNEKFDIKGNLDMKYIDSV
jgi:hypothetical protein